MYAEIAPHDPAGVLRHEWLNSRGAIPRFDRSAIEIRLVDVQECPLADVSIAAAVVTVVQWLYAERSASLVDQQALETGALARVLRATIRGAEDAIIDDAGYLRVLGIRADRCSAGDVWRALLDACARDARLASTWWQPALDAILERGPLARRILRATGERPSRRKLRDVYEVLCDCLRDCRMFE
jgi:gamma-glutamyl:cysteine ligase YbdK (ATP-grasp superfamily)